MHDDIKAFLSATPVFRECTSEQMDEIVPLFQVSRYPAGTLILKQGGYSNAVYFLRSGSCAVRVQRGATRETVAYIQPPACIGELSFVTGRQCVADVEVVVDAEVVFLPKEAVPKLPAQRDAILRGLMSVIAERLQNTVSKGTRAAEAPVIVLLNRPNFEAPVAFGQGLAKSLGEQTGLETLLVEIGETEEAPERPLGPQSAVCRLRPAENLRGDIARRLTEWKRQYTNIVLNPHGARAGEWADAIDEFGTWKGELLGPGDPRPPAPGAGRFVVQSAAAPTVEVLSGNQQLIYEAVESEEAARTGGSATKRFQRVADSMARCIAGIQVGLALGGGAAWGWAHIGVLDVLERNGVPVDCISGCSMGSVIGGFRAAGFSVEELKEIALYWRTRTKRFIEWRFWRMCLLNEKIVRKTFKMYFGDRGVNQTEIPYWANAVDIQTGKEFTVSDGSLVDCIRASIALPGLMSPATRSPHLLVDAGIMDPVPVNLVRRMGCQFTVAVNAMAAIEAQKIQKRYPFNAFDIMTRCMFVMGHEIGQARAEQSADVVFTPSLGEITMLQFNKSPEIMECGRKAAEENLPQILAGYDRLKQQIKGEQPQAAGSKI